MFSDGSTWSSGLLRLPRDAPPWIMHIARLPISNLRVKPFALYFLQETATPRGTLSKLGPNEPNSRLQTLYNNAVVELDPTLLLQKIEAAQRAILDRLDDALHGRDPINDDEEQAIEDARRNLYSLKRHPAA